MTKTLFSFLFLFFSFFFANESSAQCPTATISYDNSPYCSTGPSATVTRTGSSGGLFSGDAGLAINTVTGDVDASASTPGSHTVTYTIAASGGCGEFTTTATLQITQAPSATINYPGSPFCAVSVGFVTRTGTGGGVYTSDPGVNLDASTGTLFLGSSTPGNHIIQYTIAAANGCGAFSTSTPIVIKPVPSANISYGSTEFCKTSVAFVNRTGAAGGTYSAPAGLDVNPTTGTLYLGYSTPGTYTVNYTVTVNGCTKTAPATVTVLPLPSIAISGKSSPVCQTDNATLLSYTGTTHSPTTYSITDGTPNPLPGFTPITDASLTGSPISIPIPVGVAPGTYDLVLTVRNANGCTSAPNRFKVTVLGASSLSISYANSPYSPRSVAFPTVTGPSGGSFSASPSGLNINPTTGTLYLGSSTPGTYTVTYTYTTNSGCMLSANTSVTVNSSITIAQGSGSAAARAIGKATPVQQLESDVIVAPNPVERILRIQSTQSGTFYLRIFDMAGRSMNAGTRFTSIHNMDMSNYKPGIYIVELTNESTGEIIRRKIVKN